MELYASEDINDIQNQNKAIKQVTNLNKTNCGPFCPHKINKTIKYSGIKHAEKSNIGRIPKATRCIPGQPWLQLLFSFPLFFSPTNFPPMPAAPKRISSPNQKSFFHIYISPPKS